MADNLTIQIIADTSSLQAQLALAKAEAEVRRVGRRYQFRQYRAAGRAGRFRRAAQFQPGHDMSAFAGP
jgi:hypothetical protein